MPIPQNTGGPIMGLPSTVDSGTLQISSVGNFEIAANGVAGVLAANNVYLWVFDILVSMTVVSVRCRASGVPTGTVDMGVYDANGNLLDSTGAIATVAGANTNPLLLGNLFLSPGTYQIGLCPSNAVDTYFRLSGAANLTTNPPCRLAIGTGSAGVLPSGTGGSNLATICPAMCLIPLGGLS
jgi:hypothetical protein